MFCLKDSLRVGLPVFVIPVHAEIQVSCIFWIPALADSAGMTAEFYDEAVRHQL